MNSFDRNDWFWGPIPPSVIQKPPGGINTGKKLSGLFQSLKPFFLSYNNNNNNNNIIIIVQNYYHNKTAFNNYCYRNIKIICL